MPDRLSEKSSVKKKLRSIIFGVDTPSGKWFDIVLLWIIIFSLVVVMLESVTEFREKHGDLLHIIEWIMTGLFSIEYLARLWVTEKPVRYARSFFGIIDLLSILPTYLSFFIVGSQSLLVIRAIRLLRVFRIFKLVRYFGAGEKLASALYHSRAKILVFLGAISILVVILGTLMYLIEQGENGFTSIPRSIYWAVVTLTTVGYGDIAPQTILGQFLASIIMVLGYAVIAVPTGIISVEYAQTASPSNRKCANCGAMNLSQQAKFCENCGSSL